MSPQPQAEEVIGYVEALYRRPTRGRIYDENNVKQVFHRVAVEGEINLLPMGLQESHEYHRQEEKVADWDKQEIYDRALLCQGIANNKNMYEKFPECHSLTQYPSFGENALLRGDGLCSEKICIGDVYEIRREGKVVARLQVSQPRRPCHSVRQTHSPDVCQYVASHGTGGFFVRVLQPGSLCHGDEVVLVERLHPKWTLTYLANRLYCDTNLAYKIPHWRGPEEEIDEIMQLPELSYLE